MFLPEVNLWHLCWSQTETFPGQRRKSPHALKVSCFSLTLSFLVIEQTILNAQFLFPIHHTNIIPQTQTYGTNEGLDQTESIFPHLRISYARNAYVVAFVFFGQRKREAKGKEWNIFQVSGAGRFTVSMFLPYLSNKHPVLHCYFNRTENDLKNLMAMGYNMIRKLVVRN